MGLFELNKKLRVARQNGFIFNQLNKLTIKNYSNLSNINISYYLKHRIPTPHRLNFRGISHNKEFIENYCIDLKNLLRFACCKWY